MPDLLEAARTLARQGTPVFPLDGNKKPRTAHGFHDATVDEEQISNWNWNGDGAIGAAIPEGCIVVDVDPRNGGNDTAKILSDKGMRLPVTRTHRTKGGGIHKFYALPEGTIGKKIRGTVGPGIDIKVSGKGYVVFPPSPGYSVLFDAQIAPAPDWLISEIVAEVGESQVSQGCPPKFFNFQTGTAYGTGAMDGELKSLAAAAEGDRNNHLNRSAFALGQLCAGGEVQEEAAIRRLEYVARDLGLEDDEVSATIKSGWSAGVLEPREAPIRERVTSPDLSFERYKVGDPSSEKEYWINWDVEEEPPPFYLYPLVPKNAYILVYGATESSKSIVFMALACEGSHKGIKTSTYSLENPAHIDRDRLRRLRPNPNNLRLTKQPLDVYDMRQLNELIERNKPGGLGSWPDGKGTDWLIIDTYSHAFYSNSDDGNKKAIDFAIRMRYVMDQVGCSVIVVDHTGYENRDEPRDASAKRQQVDMAIYMEKSGVWVPKQPARFTAANKKSARFGNPFFLRGEIADVRPDDRGLELKWMLDSGQDSPNWGGA